MNCGYFSRRLMVAPALLFTLALAAAPAFAAHGLSDLDSQLSEVEGQMSAAESNPSTAGEVITKLDSLGAEFASVASAGKADKAALTSVYSRLNSMLTKMYETWKKKQDDCIAQISNNNAQCDYSTPEQLSLQALYPLSWLHYQGAMDIYSDSAEQSKQLLNQAVEGFTASTLVIPNQELVRENLLGRAYCERELGKLDKSEYDAAIADFKTIMADGPSTKQYNAAKLGMSTTYMKMGNPEEAQKYSVGGGPGDKGGGEMLHLQTLCEAEKATSDPVKKAQYHKQIVDSMREKENDKAGFAIAVKAASDCSRNPIAEFGGSADPFEKWLLANVLLGRKDKPNAARYFAEAAQSGKYPKGYKYAADIYLEQKRYDQVESLLNSMTHGAGADAQWAEYMKYSIPRSRWEQSGRNDAALEDAWVKAAGDYLQKYPEGEYAAETRFRLAERLQAQKSYVEAAQMYSQIKGSNEYSFTARYNSAECDYRALAAAGSKDNKGPAVNTAQLTSDAIAALQETLKMAPAAEQNSPAAGRKFIHDTVGRATYMLAALLEEQPNVDYAQIASILQGYEEKHPEMSSRFHDIAEWRITALDRLGKYDEVQADVATIVERSKGKPEESDFIKGLGHDFWRAATEAQAAGNQQAYLANAKLTSTAYAYFSDVVAADPSRTKNLTGTLSILGQALQAQGDEAQAEQIYQQVVKADAASPDANAGLARIAQAKKDYKTALTGWTTVENTAAESDILWYEAKYNLAIVSAAEGNVGEACQKLAQTRAEHPNLGSPEMKVKWNALQRKLCLEHKTE